MFYFKVHKCCGQMARVNPWCIYVDKFIPPRQNGRECRWLAIGWQWLSTETMAHDPFLKPRSRMSDPLQHSPCKDQKYNWEGIWGVEVQIQVHIRSFVKTLFIFIWAIPIAFHLWLLYSFSFLCDYLLLYLNLTMWFLLKLIDVYNYIVLPLK